MIISQTHGFIFIANLKTASSAIESSLAPMADIHLKTTSGGKHMSYREIDRLILSRWPRKYTGDPDKLFSFGVMRDPVSFALSVYNSHTKEAFKGAPHYTGDKTFEEFLDRMLNPVRRWQLRDQREMFIDEQGKPAVDFILRYEALPEDLQKVCERLSLKVKLEHSNESPKKLTPSRISKSSRALLSEIFALDYQFYSDFAGRFISDN